MSEPTSPSPPPDPAPPSPPPPNVEAGYLPPPPPKQPGSGVGGCTQFALIGCGAMLVLALLVGVGGTLWWSHSGKVTLSRTRAQGERDGAATDEAGCYRLAQARPGTGFSEGVRLPIYMQACLSRARLTPDFCDGVPNPDDSTASAGWLAIACPGKTAVHCQGVAEERQLYCRDYRTGRPEGMATPPGDSARQEDSELR